MDENNINENLKNELEENNRKPNWSAFVEATAVHFLDKYNLEKMSLEDGNGNKAKISRTKDDNVKVEHSTTVIL